MEPAFAVNTLRSRHAHPDRINLARAFHVRLPDYAPSPLLELSDLAAELGIGRLWVKDETRRFQMSSFELLGAGWALYREVLTRLGRRIRWEDMVELVAQLDLVDSFGAPRVVVVSDDGFATGAARAARLFGFACVVFAPAEASPQRLSAIEAEGATVVAVPGGYDAALFEAAKATVENDVILSDSSWEDFDEIPGWVTEGYATVFEEVDDELDVREAPTLDAVVIPLGVGALAAACARFFRAERFTAQPWLLGVEPADAACFVEGVAAGRRVALPQPAVTVMETLARGLPSPLAWEVVADELDAFVAIGDARAEEAVARLGARGIAVNASGAAALGGLLEVVARRADWGIPLDRSSSVLVVATEAPLPQ